MPYHQQSYRTDSAEAPRRSLVHRLWSSTPWIAVAIGVAVAGAACSHNSTEPVRLVAIGPWQAEFAQEYAAGITLAARVLNEQADKQARKILVSFWDDRADPALSIVLADQAARDPRVDAIVGPLNSASVIAASRSIDGRIVALTTAAAPEIASLSPWIKAYPHHPDASSAELGAFARDQGWKRVVMVFENTTIARRQAAAFRIRYGGQLLGDDPIAPSGSGMDIILAAYAPRRPDAIAVFGDITSRRAVLTSARTLNLHVTLVTTDSPLSATSSRQDTISADGVIVAESRGAQGTTPPEISFERTFRHATGRRTTVTAAVGYDVTTLLAEAARRSTSRAEIREALTQLAIARPYSGASGRFQIASAEDQQRVPVDFYRITHGMRRTIAIRAP